jgi:hypothetical protein
LLEKKSLRLTGFLSIDAYYIFIHPYLPILPPPTSIPVDQPVIKLQNQLADFEEQYEPSSPLGLAICAILALIPCPDDVDPASPDSVLFRRKYSHFLAQAAMEAIESDSENPESAISPSKALESWEPTEKPQPHFHPRLPTELEGIVALDILSIYEYSQRGNLKKMQSRAYQAFSCAMAHGLHKDSSEDEFSEARRRVWWMTVSLIITRVSSTSSPSPSLFFFFFLWLLTT